VCYFHVARAIRRGQFGSQTQDPTAPRTLQGRFKEPATMLFQLGNNVP
jgi:hypothetical protein